MLPPWLPPFAPIDYFETFGIEGKVGLHQSNRSGPKIEEIQKRLPVRSWIPLQQLNWLGSGSSGGNSTA
jgi:hypothetical protein